MKKLIIYSIIVFSFAFFGCGKRNPVSPGIIDTQTATAAPTTADSTTPTVTRTGTPVDSATMTSTAADSATPTATETSTDVSTVTPTATNTVTATLSVTYTLTDTPTGTDTPTSTATYTVSETYSITYSATDTPTGTDTPTPADTYTITATSSITHTSTDTPTCTDTPTTTATYTISETSTISATVTETLTQTCTHTITETHTVTPTQTLAPFVMQFAKGLYPDASYTDMEDANLSSYFTSRTYGGCNYLTTVNDANSSRTLMRFGLSSIPANAVISGATLFISVGAYYNYSTPPYTLNCYRVTTQWTEANLCSATIDAGTNTYPTWTKTGFGLWTAPGGDYAELIGSFSGSGAGQYTFPISASVIQDWVDGVVPNYGFVIIADTAKSGGFGYTSSEGLAGVYRPRLTVYYYLP